MENIFKAGVEEIEKLEQGFVALFRRDSPAAITALNVIETGAQEFAALAAAGGAPANVITAAGKVAGVASLGAAALTQEATASTVTAVAAGVTGALSELKATGVIGDAAQAKVNALDAKATAVASVLTNIATTPAAAEADQ